MSFINYQTAIQKFIHLEEILQLIAKLQNQDQINQAEELFRELESHLVSDNLNLIINIARETGEQLIINPSISSPQSKEEAVIQRYIFVPILYKLGFTKDASDLGQMTFEYLFPIIHSIILNKLHKLFNSDLNQLKQDIIKLFFIDDINISKIYARMKSTNSIWKKIKSIQQLQLMGFKEFSEIIDDFIALRWNMKVNEAENRYDALLNGVRLIPKDSIVRFRNQQVSQRSGFSREPIIKFYYFIQDIPVELQLLGGLIENYMCAKAYTSHKVGLDLNPLHLTEEEQNARLGLCIYYSEQGKVSDFHKMMLKELISKEKIYYEAQHTLILTEVPNNPENQLLCFAGEKIPIYLMDNYVFEKDASVLTHKLF